MKAILVATALLTLSNAHALGPEEQEFIGMVHGRMIALQFQDDPDLYSAGDASRLARCSYQDPSVICSDGTPKGDRLIYLKGDQSSNQVSAARALYERVYPKQKNGAPNSKGDYNGYFACTVGCSSEVPELLVLITHGD